jgi:asparagine synthase (glutamine-hydrolysing)
MCGIAGILNLDQAAPPDESLLRQMLAMIRHRGPDEFGIYRGDGVALGSARLSIIDLSGGQQPISNEDGRLWIVFNGEIFNYVELRAELEARGHRFSTRTDTEAILHLYEDLGPECLQKLNGQFAIAIWDERERSLFLARDRVGVRPVFYTQSGGRLVFGSEIKSILSVCGVRAEIDPVGLAQVFTYWSPQAPVTCFKDICELPAGHYLVARNRQLQVSRYWRLEFDSPPRDREQPLGDYVEELRHLLLEATRIRLRADVPVGAYLSGGLDSSMIAAMVRHLGVSHLDTFSISFSDPRYDESPHQRRMAEFLGTEHQVVYATHEEIGRVFPEVIWHAEAPLLRTAPAPMFLLSKLVRDRRYKVVLTGEGADEFLAGYDIFKEAKIRHFWARQPQSIWRPRLLQRIYPDIQALTATGASFLSAFFGARLQEVNAPDYSHANRWRNGRRHARLFSNSFQDLLKSGGYDGGRPAPVPEHFARWDALQRAQYVEISTFLSQYLLSSQGDRPAMAHAVEGRFPFLDVRVMEFCNRLPSRFKLRGLTEKYLLRQVAKEWLPAEILARVKRPYRAPIQQSFFNATTRGSTNDLLSSRRIQEAGVFNPAAVGQLLQKARTETGLGETDEMALVGIISTQLLHQRFISGFSPAPPLSAHDSVKVRIGRSVAR